MWRQERYDDATTGTDTRALDLIIAIAQVHEVAARLNQALIAETRRSFERPEANPLNWEAAS